MSFAHVCRSVKTVPTAPRTSGCLLAVGAPPPPAPGKTDVAPVPTPHLSQNATRIMPHVGLSIHLQGIGTHPCCRARLHSVPLTSSPLNGRTTVGLSPPVKNTGLLQSWAIMNRALCACRFLLKYPDVGWAGPMVSVCFPLGETTKLSSQAAAPFCTRTHTHTHTHTIEENIVGQDLAEVGITHEDGVWENVLDPSTLLACQHFVSGSA